MIYSTDPWEPYLLDQSGTTNAAESHRLAYPIKTLTSVTKGCFVGLATHMAS
jgi:hypothetical protein